MGAITTERGNELAEPLDECNASLARQNLTDESDYERIQR